MRWNIKGIIVRREKSSGLCQKCSASESVGSLEQKHTEITYLGKALMMKAYPPVQSFVTRLH